MELLLGFALGLIGNFVAQWLLDRRRERGIRRVMREGLASEVLHNLRVLDSYEDVFTPAKTNFLDLRWPDAQLVTSVMENCLDPQSLALLSTAEQGKVPLLFHQLTEVRDEMRDAWLEIRSNPRNEAVVPLRNWHIDRFLIQDVPIVAQNLVDMLCHVMAHQDRFASYHAATISASVISSEAEFGSLMDRVWRTSDLKRTVTGPRTANRALFAWRNDDPTQVPEGMRVVSLSPPEGGDYSIDLGSKQRVLVLANALNLRRRRRGTKRHAESLQRRSGCS